jgi:hypothetical protein
MLSAFILSNHAISQSGSNKKQKQRLWITDEKKKVYKEKDKLARETAGQIMSPEKRRFRE